MLRIFIALSDFATLSDANTLKFATKVGSRMDNNGNFSIPEVASLLLATERFRKLIGEAATGNRSVIAAKNDAKKEVRRLLKVIVKAINEVAAGNKELLETTGYNVSGSSTPKPLGKPTLSVSDGDNSGTLVATAKGTTNAKALIFQACLKADFTGNIVNIGSTQKKVVFELEPKQEYFVRVQAVGTKKQRIYSDVVSRLTQ